MANRNRRCTPPTLLELPRSRAALRKRLVRWFDQFRRDFPWRRDRDPYRVWVSEVMLQQTQASAVIPYFDRFMQAFPTVAALAGADEQAVLRLWEGLGYYRRARDLHRAACCIMADHQGRIPAEPRSLLQLPGLGRYTCNAVLSQAFDRRLPILEANSQRVLSRLYGCTDDPRCGPARAYLWEKAEEMLPLRRAGDFNQAVMELGALICTPAAPRCSECPVAAWCAARQRGIQEEIPRRARPPKIIRVQESAIVVWKRHKVLLVQRPASGRWAGLWEFPHGPKKDGESFAQAAQQHLRASTGFEAEIKQVLITLHHSITRYRVTMACFEAKCRAGAFQPLFYQQARWIEPSRLADYPVSAPQRRLAKLVVAQPRQGRLF